MDTDDVVSSERKPVSLGRQPTLTQAQWLPTHRRSDLKLLWHSTAHALRCHKTAIGVPYAVADVC